MLFAKFTNKNEAVQRASVHVRIEKCLLFFFFKLEFVVQKKPRNSSYLL